MYKIEFEINKLPKMPNSLLGRHWRSRSAHAAHWESLIFRTVGRNLPPKPLVHAALTLIRKSSVEPDFDGLCGSFKAVIDALVKIGVLENDKMSNIGQPKYSWEKAKPSAGKIKVIVEAVAK